MITGNWSALELRHLAALLAVADEGSFAAAAERLGYTQAAVSQQVAALERIVGARLIRRSAGRRPQGVTRPGKVVLNYAKTVLADIRTVQSELATVATEQAVALRIGICASIAARLLPEVTSRFLSRMPEASLDLVDGLSDSAMLAMVRDGELDVAFVGLPADGDAIDEAFETVELLADPYALLIPADVVVNFDEPTPAVLADLPLIGFRSCAEGGPLEQQLLAHDIVPRYKLRTDSYQVLRDLVAAGVGYGLVPMLAVPADDRRLTALPIKGLTPRRFGAVRSREEPPTAALQAYLEMAVEYGVSLRSA